jgi:hypothetical protein
MQRSSAAVLTAFQAAHRGGGGCTHRCNVRCRGWCSLVWIRWGGSRCRKSGAHDLEIDAPLGELGEVAVGLGFQDEKLLEAVAFHRRWKIGGGISLLSQMRCQPHSSRCRLDGKGGGRHRPFGGEARARCRLQERSCRSAGFGDCGPSPMSGVFCTYRLALCMLSRSICDAHSEFPWPGKGITLSRRESKRVIFRMALRLHDPK